MILQRSFRVFVYVFVIAIPAWLIVQYIEPLEVMGAPVLAILIGMVFTLYAPPLEETRPGIAFTSKKSCRLWLFYWALA